MPPLLCYNGSNAAVYCSLHWHSKMGNFLGEVKAQLRSELIQPMLKMRRTLFLEVIMGCNHRCVPQTYATGALMQSVTKEFNINNPQETTEK